MFTSSNRDYEEGEGMNIAELRSFILESDVLPPTVAKELEKNIDSLPLEHVSWLVTLLDRAQLADKEYGRASEEYLACIRAVQAHAFERVADEEARIMAQFEDQLLNSIIKA